MSSVSVVMVSYNTGVSLWLAIESALAQPECTQLILVNNGNPAGVETLLAQRAASHPRMSLISGHGNVGFAKACNVGAKAATSDYILLLNPDCMLPEGGLARALEGMTHYPQNTMAGCFLANPDGLEQRGGRRGLLTPYNAVFESLGLSFLLPKDQQLNLNRTKMPLGAHEVPAISGAFMLLSRGFYERMNGMDESYFLHMEDMDFCYRIHKAGGKIICLPEVRVLHFRSTSEVASGFVEKEKAKSFLRYLTVHFSDDGSRFFIMLMTAGLGMRSVIKRFANALNRIFEPPLYAKQGVARLAVLYGITRFENHPQTLAGKTLLVTGASGQLGLCIVGGLLARGASVIAVTRRSKIAFTHDNLSWVERDLESKAPLLGAEVDMVIHAADITYLPRLFAGLCDGGTTRLIAFSCIPVLDKAASAVKYDKERAKSFEASEKELLATGKAKGCDVTIFRPTGMYGVGLDDGLTRQADIVSRYGKLPLQFPGNGERQPVHVRDVADAAMKALENPVTYGKVYAIGGGSVMSYREMLERIFAYFGKEPRFMRIPAMQSLLTILGKLYGLKNINGDRARQMNRSFTAVNNVAQQEFGYSARPFLEGETGF